MTIRDIVIALGFKVDQDSESKAEDKINGLKDFAFKALGALAIGFSLTSINALAEEFVAINDKIKFATKDLGEQAEIQDKILKAANDTKMAYGDTAEFVTKLVQENSELFGSVDDAVAFNNAMTKLFMTAGKGADEITGLQEAINMSFAKGAVDSETIGQLLEQSPEAVKLLNKQLGTTTDQLEQMATDGKIKLSDLRDAFVSNAEEIDKNFEELDYSISDAILNIRNQWGKFCDSLNSGSGIFQTIAKAMVKGFTKLMELLKKMQPTIERIIKIAIRGATIIWNSLEKVGRFIEKIVKKLGGVESVLKLLTLIGGALFVALNAGKVLGFLKDVMKLLSGINLTTLLIVGVIVALALIVEDFINFMQGNDSVIGELFKKAGIDAEEVRKKILAAWENIKTFLLGVWEFIKTAAGIVSGAINDFFTKHNDDIQANFERAWGLIKTFLNGVWTFLSQLAATLFGKQEDDINNSSTSIKDTLLSVWEAIVGALSAVWETLYEIGSAIFNTIAAELEAVFAGLKIFWDTWGTEILAWFKTVWNSLGGIINSFLGVVKGLANFIKAVFTGDWEGAWNAIKDIFINLWNMIVNALTAVWETIKLLFTMGLSAIKGIWEAAWTNISGFFSGIWNAIVSFVESMLGKITSAISNITIGISTAVGKIKDTIVNGFTKAIDWIKGLQSQALTWGKDLIEGIIKGIKEKIGDVGEAVKGVADKIKSFLHFSVPDEGPLTDYESWMPDFMGGLAKGIRSNLPLIESAMSDMSKLMASAVQVPQLTIGNTPGAGSRSNTFNQSNSIVNQFSGYDRKTQLQAAGAMSKSARDITDYMASGLNYGR